MYYWTCETKSVSWSPAALQWLLDSLQRLRASTAPGHPLNANQRAAVVRLLSALHMRGRGAGGPDAAALAAARKQVRAALCVGSSPGLISHCMSCADACVPRHVVSFPTNDMRFLFPLAGKAAGTEIQRDPVRGATARLPN